MLVCVCVCVLCVVCCVLCVVCCLLCVVCCVCVCCVCMYVCCVCMYICLYVCMCVCVVCVCIYVCMYVCVFKCVCVVGSVYTYARIVVFNGSVYAFLQTLLSPIGTKLPLEEWRALYFQLLVRLYIYIYMECISSIGGCWSLCNSQCRNNATHTHTQ